MVKKILGAVGAVAVISLSIGVAYKAGQSAATQATPDAKAPRANSTASEPLKPDGSSDNAKNSVAGEVTLTPSQIDLLAIKTSPVTFGEIGIELAITGEIGLDQDRLSHIISRIPGVVTEVKKTLGDAVRRGEVLAVISSRELADAKAAYLAASERAQLAQTNFAREEDLWKKKISAEKDYLEAKQDLAGSRIELRLTEQKLHALGFSEEYVRSLPSQPEILFTRYEVTAPIDGTVIAKHAVEGELVGEEDFYAVCDLDTVWLIASVYEKDIARIKKGQPATIRAKAYPERTFRGEITWIGDTLDEESRTLKIRAEIDNRERLLKPGMFVNADLLVETSPKTLVAPAAALQTQGEDTIAFVDKGGGRFERRAVKIGTRASDVVEIIGGLKEGETVVTSGSFGLRSELDKGSFGGDE